MTSTDSMTTPEESTVERPTQKQIVENLISNKKKSSNKQEIAEFTKEWSKLASKDGVSDITIGLLIDGYSIAGATPLFELMGTDDSCLATLRGMKKLPKIIENPHGASLRIYVHLFALSVNAGRSWDCINSIISMIPRLAYNKEGKPFGTNSATISKYLLRELNARKAFSVLAGTDLQESTANKLVKIFAPAFKEATTKKKPIKVEVASVKALKKWLESKTTQIEATTAISKPPSGTLRLKEDSINKEPGGENQESNATSSENESDITHADTEVKINVSLTYDSVISAIRKLERSHSITESKLSSAESVLKEKEGTIAKLKASLDEANNRITALKEMNSEKQQQIDNSNYRIEKLQHEIEETKSTADARAEMITMLDKNRDQKGSEVLARIASKLKADYGDFKEYEGEAMTVELGEIVKLQLGQVFETLKSAGVKL